MHMTDFADLLVKVAIASLLFIPLVVFIVHKVFKSHTKLKWLILSAVAVGCY